MTNVDGSSIEPEVKALEETLERWMDEHLDRNRVRELDDARSVPTELWRKLGELGITGLLVPKEYDGSEADVRFDYAVIRALGGRYASMAAGYMVISMAAKFVTLYGNDAQRAGLLPPAGPR